jgi:hypothetical protein
LAPCENIIEARSRDKAGNYSVVASKFVKYTPPNTVPKTPANISPANGATGVLITPTLQASAFSDPDCVGDTHQASQWQVLNGAGAVVVADSGTNTASLTSWIVPANKLYYGSNYQWRVRYRDSRNGWSSNSLATTFTTGDACTYSLNPASTNFAAGSGFGSFTVTASVGCAWTGLVNQAWIHTSSSGRGNGTVSYTVDANMSTSSRTGTIVVQGQAFAITQAAPAPVITALQPNQVPPGGGYFVLSVIGSNFVAGSVIRWNGANQATTFVNSNSLMAIITQTLIAAPGTASITVLNPDLGGGAVSSEALLTIADAAATPRITLQRSNNMITLGWPSEAIGFKLQSTPILPATNWTDVTGSNATNAIGVTNGEGRQFFRLKK